MTNKPMLSVEREPVAWAVEISGCLKFFEQKKSSENARRRYEKVMDAERMEPFPLFAEQPAPVAVVMPERMKTEPFTTIDRGSKNYKAGYNAAIAEVAKLNGLKP